MRKQSRSEYKLAIRERAKQKVRPRFTPKGQKAQGDVVEAGRRTLLTECSEGGDSRAKKAKNELNYLLNNYSPRYDSRIEMLIDQWRRSGDPSYDPSIQIRYRQARQHHMNKGNPL